MKEKNKKTVDTVGFIAVACCLLSMLLMFISSQPAFYHPNTDAKGLLFEASCIMAIVSLFVAMICSCINPYESKDNEYDNEDGGPFI